MARKDRRIKIQEGRTEIGGPQHVEENEMGMMVERDSTGG